MNGPRTALVLEGPEGSLGAVALRLVRLGLAVHYANFRDEALLLLGQEEGRIRAIVVPPDIDPAEARRVCDEARSLASEGCVSLVVIGARPAAEVRAALHEAGASWAVWEPFDDGDLRFVLNSAMALPSELAPRSEPRAPVSLICWIQIGRTRSFGVLSSLSSRGGFVEMAQPLPVGTQVQLEFGLGEMTVETDARIIYRNAPEEHRAPSLALGCGVLFEDIDSDDQERIRNFVRRRAARFTV